MKFIITFLWIKKKKGEYYVTKDFNWYFYKKNFVLYYSHFILISLFIFFVGCSMLFLPLWFDPQQINQNWHLRQVRSSTPAFIGGRQSSLKSSLIPSRARPRDDRGPPVVSFFWLTQPVALGTFPPPQPVPENF